MSHPDLAKKFGYYPSFSLESLYDEMAEAARAGGRMVEVNTSGGYYACAEMFPAPGLLAAFCRAGVPCTVGCDSHDPANVAGTSSGPTGSCTRRATEALPFRQPQATVEALPSNRVRPR